MLSRMSISDFIRDAIGMKIDVIRANYGLTKPDNYDIYDDFYEFEDEDDCEVANKC